MKEIIDGLKKIINEIENLTEITVVSKKLGLTIADAILYKNIEDGLLKKIDTANEVQLEFMLNSFSWRYYKEDRTFSHFPNDSIKKQIENEILRKKRQKKLERINEI